MSKNKLVIRGVAFSVLIAAIVPMAMAAGPIKGTRIVQPKLQAVDTSTGAYRFVIKYKDGAAELRDTTVQQKALNAAVSRAGLNRAGTSAVSSRGPVQATQLRRLGVPGWSVVKTSRKLNATEARAFLQELKADPAVAKVEIDQMYRPTLVPNDTRYATYQWNFSNAVGSVNAESAWDVPNGQGEGAVVAVLDTGIVQNHMDLANNVIPGYDMITDHEVSRRETDERVPGGWDVGDWVEANYCGGTHAAEDSSWHGSHVAGTIAQETNNASGLAGLAFKAKVMPVRVLGSCGGYGSDIADGIIWASGGTVTGMPANTNVADVINMSLGSVNPASCPALYQDAINGANSRGTIVVVAAGNDDADAGTYTMGSCSGTIVVGATGISGARAYYSNWGTRVDLSAPGGGVNEGSPNGYIWQIANGGTTRPDTTWYYTGMAGTSMASPHVAAAVAMVQGALSAANRDPLSWTAMRDLLKQTARPFPVAPPSNKPIGAGILNVKAALDEALEVPCDPQTQDCGTPLTNKVAVSGLSGAAGSETLFTFEAQAGSVLSIMTYGGTGDVSLYVKFDAQPTPTSYDAKSTRAGNSETVRFTAPQAGTYQIKLVGVTAFSGVTIVARQ